MFILPRIVAISLLLLVAFAPALAHGQTTADWIAGDGAFLTPANWSTGDVPGDEPGVDESARFDLAIGADIELPTSAPLTLLNIDLVAGATTLMVPGGSLNNAMLDVTGALSARMAGRLVVEEDVELTAQQTTIASIPTDSSIIDFRRDSQGNLGVLQIGSSQAGSQDSVLRVSADASVVAGNTSINAGGVAQHTAAIEITASQFHQQPGATLTVGADVASGAAFIFVQTGGELRVGSGGASIHQTGSIRNNSGDVQFLGNLTITGDTIGYRENIGSGATRSFVPGATIEFSGGGRAQFDAAPLLLDDGQRMVFADSGSAATAAGDVMFGADSTLSMNFLTAPFANLPLLQAEGTVSLAGAMVVSLEEGGPPPAPGITLPIASAGLGFSGAFDSWQVPAVAGLTWQPQIVGDTLSLLAVAALPGDFNSDGLVDTADYSQWRETLGSETDLAADANGSGRIDTGDYQIWRQNFGSPQPAATSSAHSLAVPEPSAILLAVLFAALAMVAKNRDSAIDC